MTQRVSSAQQQTFSRRRKACENCRRRKERCDGFHPCGRCRTRKVESQCKQLHSTEHPVSPRRDSDKQASVTRATCSNDDVPMVLARSFGFLDAWQGLDNSTSPPSRMTVSRNLSISSSVGSMVCHTSRLICNDQGEYIFLGPSANLSVLQSIRQIIHKALGTSQFSKVPAEDDPINSSATNPLNSIETSTEPARPSIEDALYYIRWFSSATSCVFDLFGHDELTTMIVPWLEQPSTTDANTCIYFLVLAIGAQCGPKNRDDEAEAYFNYSRYLLSARPSQTTNIAIVQIHCLIATYLLNAACPQSANMQLVLAIRAAHSLGIHRADINALFPPAENLKRERIWKILRVQDLFLSTSLGQQPATTETRQNISHQGYSASTDLCHIFEKILSEVYSKEEVPPSVLENVSQHHRKWASRFREGLVTDHISDEHESSDTGEKKLNIGLCHLKEAYYWTIMLVTRPYLMDLVQRQLANEEDPSLLHATDDMHSSSANPSSTLLAHASVNSAVLTIDLLQSFLHEKEIPKRLPYVVNSVFNSALVIGIGYLANLDSLYPLNNAMHLAERLLERFQFHDALAKWGLKVIRDLHNTCHEYVRRRCDRQLKHQGALLEGLFGDVESVGRPERPLYVSRSCPDGISQLRSQSSDFEDLYHLPQTAFSELPHDLQIEDNGTTWDHLFYDSLPGPLWEANLEPGSLPFEWP
ncbi:uncharacterized protein N7458_000349 [Penicillium daleae]|uniref:Zn(2)-C6 fungal-type domain-containing protein n=1 Tax=Penicillium daleae TaxID=63821 RepID=A0AAD6CGE2_9EURO|nr:uncharacterized protein N7458_000349 [Penicillium daleae]KAJ5464663.1 hypothetical protein N7458_000349 [Penicillium daleae]